jgi:YesN/AraC family two-component response regulator
MQSIPGDMAHSLNQVQLRIEQTMQIQHRLVLSLSNDNDILSFLDSAFPSSNSFQSIDKVRKKFNNLFVYDLGILDYALINIRNGWILSINGVTPIKNERLMGYLENLDSVSSFSRWYADHEEKQFFDTGNSLFWVQGKTVKYICAFPTANAGKGGVYISVSIPFYWFSRQFALDDAAEDILLVDETGHIVACKNESMNGTFLSASPYKEIEGKFETSASGFIRSRGSNLVYSFSKDSFTGWTFVYVSNIRHALAEIIFLRNISIILGLMLVAAVIIFAFFRTRAIYYPVKKEFERQNLIRSQLNQELFVYHLINSNIPNNLLNEKIRLYEFPECPDCCRVILIQVELMEEYVYDQKNKDLLYISLKYIASKEMDKFLCFPVVTDGDNVIMIAGADTQEEKFKRNLVMALERLQERIHNEVHADTGICVSSNAESYAAIPMCRSQANKMFKYNFGYKNILFAEDLEQALVVYMPFPQHLEDALHSAIRRGDSQESDSILKQFIGYTLENDSFKQGYYLTFSRLLVGILRLSQEYLQEENSPGFWGKTFEQFFLLKTEKQIFVWVKMNYIDPLLSHIQQIHLKKEANIIQKMKTIAETRYGECLSIETISADFSCSPSYMRQIFRKGTGITFNEYLNKCRMNAAKKMLIETDMHVLAIGKKLTYQNSQSFIRAFHKETGMTPKEYQKLNKLV